MENAEPEAQPPSKPSKNSAHFVVLKQACRIIGRDYNIVVSFKSFREEEHTIQCAVALIIVFLLTFISMQSALEYLLFDATKSLPKAASELLLQVSTVVPAVYAVIILMLDRSILNGERADKEKEEDAKESVFGFMRLGMLRVIFSRPTLAFRAALILVVATMSSLFISARLNAQLMTVASQDEIDAKISSERSKSDLLVSELSKRRAAEVESRRSLFSESNKHNGELRKSDVERDKELSALFASYQRQRSELELRLESCADDCSDAQLKLQRLRQRYQLDRNEINSRSRLDKREQAEKQREAASALAEIERVISDLERQIVDEQRRMSEFVERSRSEAKMAVEDRQSFAALLRYSVSGDDAGRLISLGLFVVVFVFFLVVDGSVLVLKFSYSSLYDRYMDIKHLNERDRIDRMRNSS